jgi:antitoxin ParD1/3/4
MESQGFEKFSITLPGEMARVIHERVSSGDYGSVSEVIREAMRAWLQRERRLAALDEAIARGIADAEAGRVQTIEEVRGEVRAELGIKERT